MPHKSLQGALPITRLMTLAYSAIIVLVVLLVSVIFSFYARDIAISTFEGTNKKLLNETGSRLDSLMETVASLSHFGANNQQLQTLLKAMKVGDPVGNVHLSYQIRSLLSDYWLYKPELVGICVYTDKVDTTTSHTISVSTTEFARQNGWLAQLGERRSIILGGGERYSRGQFATPFSILTLVKILDAQETLLGYLSFELSENYISTNYLQANKATPHAQVYMVDQQGEVIASKDKDLLGMALEWDQTARLVDRQEGRFLQVRSDPNDMAWRLLELIPLNEININVRAIMISILLGIGVGALVGIPLMGYISVRISRPIVQLSGVIKEEQTLSDAHRKAYSSQMNEIGALYRNYYEMLKRNEALLLQVKSSLNDLRKAEISALQAQINPHFMYNTLDYINWLSQDGDHQSVSHMLTHLSRFLRLSLNGLSSVCTLKGELDHVTAYLEIFKMRHASRFTYTVECQPELETMYVPRFILQPLVENALIHGFDKQMIDARIRVGVTREGSRLRVDVRDNGVGMTAQQLQCALQQEPGEEPKGGFGLRNIQDRMRCLCGAGYSGLMLSPVAQGTHLFFLLPLRQSPTEFEV